VHPPPTQCIPLCHPQYFSIVGYSRSKMSNEEFRDLISENLTCRVTSGEDCGREMEEYLDRCTYVAVRAQSCSRAFRRRCCCLVACSPTACSMPARLSAASHRPGR
jgi:Glucose-6-phosphate dehydrogenase, NAD binding domain